MSLSAELTAAAESERRSPLGLSREAQLFERAAAVCALVEAFQAAEQALCEVTISEDARVGATVQVRYSAAVSAYETAKARLLEVNLG